jgi:hypothetical protein
MSVRPLLFAAAIAMLGACSDNTGPSQDVTKKTTTTGSTSQPIGGGQTGVGHPSPVK